MVRKSWASLFEAVSDRKGGKNETKKGTIKRGGSPKQIRLQIRSIQLARTRRGVTCPADPGGPTGKNLGVEKREVKR